MPALQEYVSGEMTRSLEALGYGCHDGGLVFSLAGRVPSRGELLTHPSSGLEFEIIDADPRRIKRIRVRNPPPPASK